MVRRVYVQLSDDVMIDAIGRLPSVPNTYRESVTPIRKPTQTRTTRKAR